MLVRSLLIVSALLGCASAQVTTPIMFARDYNFPPVGLASSETAQVNLVNMATPATATPVAANPVAAACTGTVTFVNASGATVGSPISFNTIGSQIYSTELSFSKLATSGLRAEFVARVQWNVPVTAPAPCSLVFSLETFDNTTGATHVFLGNSATIAIPMPLVPGAAAHY